MPWIAPEEWLGPEGDRWKAKLDNLLARGRVTQALRLLDQISNDPQMLLFYQTANERSKQLAWLYKIDLLRSLRRYREALAWT